MHSNAIDTPSQLAVLDEFSELTYIIRGRALTDNKVTLLSTLHPLVFSGISDKTNEASRTSAPLHRRTQRGFKGHDCHTAHQQHQHVHYIVFFLLVDDEQSLTRTGRNINDNNAEAAEMATQRTNLT